MALELDKEQLKAIEKLESGCILAGGVGSGKSRAALAYFFLKECRGDLKINGKGEYKEPETPMDLYIITTAKKRDSLEWAEEMIHFLLSRDSELNPHGMTVTIDSWNNISRYQEISSNIGKKGSNIGKKRAFFIFDEQRVVGSGAWVKSFLKIAKNNHWILLSATPADVWMDYIPVFVANGFYKNKTEFTERHVVYNRFAKYPKVDRYVETDRLKRLERDILVWMPVKRHTIRHTRFINADFDREVFDRVVKERWHVFEDRPIRDIAELISVARRVVNSDPARMGEIVKLLGVHPRLIVFYNFNYELEILRRVLGERGIPYSEWNGHRHDAIPSGDSWVYLVQYLAGAEGWNCVETDAIAFYSLNYSYRIMEQARGRIDRMNTPYTHLYYYNIKSLSAIDASIMKALREKRNFNEKDFKS